VLGLGVIMLLTYAGYIAPWSGRFYSLWDTGYAKIHIPLIASVSEHQPTTWVSFFFDLHITAAIFPAGLWLCIKRVNDERVFVILYAVTAVYFAGVMVRLMLTLTPVVCVLAGVAFSELFEKYMINDSLGDVTSPPNSKGKRKVIQEPASNSNVTANYDNGFNIGLNTRSVVIILFIFILSMFVAHCTYVTSHAYSSPSVVLQSYTSRGPVIMDDFREAYYWLRQNTDENAKVMSWWDYGYQIAGMANRTTLVDNNTWNNTHISRVGQAMSSNESAAYEIMQELDVDYVLVIFGGVTGYSGDDINKFLWMVRIGGSTPEGAHIKEDDYFSKSGEYRVDKEASDIFKQCVMYKLCYYRFGGIMTEHGLGYDRVRRSIIGNKDFKLEHLEEAYTTENWIVRIYRVKKPNNRGL
uniref:Dolichyl-diphosphooligosaccharide--protein glycotransferase n=1 Tax=Panagrolaimus sp. PS1159 TaxID=55785 RepID=A0AC35EZF0_9BILA